MLHVAASNTSQSSLKSSGASSMDRSGFVYEKNTFLNFMDAEEHEDKVQALRRVYSDSELSQSHSSFVYDTDDIASVSGSSTSPTSPHRQQQKRDKGVDLVAENLNQLEQQLELETRRCEMREWMSRPPGNLADFFGNKVGENFIDQQTADVLGLRCVSGSGVLRARQKNMSPTVLTSEEGGCAGDDSGIAQQSYASPLHGGAASSSSGSGLPPPQAASSLLPHTSGLRRQPGGLLGGMGPQDSGSPSTAGPYSLPSRWQNAGYKGAACSQPPQQHSLPKIRQHEGAQGAASSHQLQQSDMSEGIQRDFFHQRGSKMAQRDLLQERMSKSSQRDSFVNQSLPGGGDSRGGDSLQEATPSKSELHAQGKCRPCKFQMMQGSCEAGDSCPFCHLHHRSSRLRPSKAARQRCKALADGLEAGSPEAEKLAETNPYLRGLFAARERASTILTPGPVSRDGPSTIP